MLSKPLFELSLHKIVEKGKSILLDILSVFKEVVLDTRGRLKIHSCYPCKVEELMVIYSQIDEISMSIMVFHIRID